MIVAIVILCSLILITYLLYPLVMISLSALKAKPAVEQHPPIKRRVYLFMAAHNEALVIRNTLDHLLKTTFPLDQLYCYIGSDASTDETDRIIEEYNAPLNLDFTVFATRQGKPSTINQLVAKAQLAHRFEEDDLFLLTDANVFLDKDYIQELSNVFNSPETGLADGIVSDRHKRDGVGGSERQYLRLETQLKVAESVLFGYSMGPFGGAYMIRSNLYEAVPEKFLVDDFFIFYNILQKGYRSKVVVGAHCYEAVSGSLREEFKRKERISTGNFQNTVYYISEMIRIWKLPNLLFLLHKFLRWISPICAAVVMVLLAVSAVNSDSARIGLLIMISLLVVLPLLNYLLNQVNLSVRWLQGISYFIIMNFALLTGFLKYLKGVRSNVWEPTKRSN